MVLILIEGSNPFAVHHKTLEWLLRPAINAVNWLVPHPQTLRTGVDRGSDTKATIFLLFKKDAIQKEGFAGAVLSSHGDHTDGLICEVHQELSGLLSHRETYKTNQV